MGLLSANKKRGLAVLFTIVIFLLLGVFVFQSRTIVADILWEKFHTASVVLILDNTAERAVVIGNYYFNTDGNGVYNLMRAAEFYQRALAIDPQAPDAWHQLARIDFLDGDFDSALEKINKQIEIHGDSLMSSYYIRGLISGFRKDYDQAEKDFQKFLAWDSTNWAAHNDLAWIYFQQGKFKQAEGIAQQGLVYNPNNPWLLTSHGVSLLNLGRRDEAQVQLEYALAQAQLLTPYAWERAYPGNDPRIAPVALEKMIEAIEHNLALVHKQ